MEIFTYDTLNIEYEVEVTPKELSELLGLTIVKDFKLDPSNISKIKNRLSEKLKYPVKDVKYNEDTKRWILTFDYLKHYGSSSLYLIGKTLNNDVEKRIKINLHPANLRRLKQITSKVRRVRLMGFDGEQGFYITKFSSIHYINFIASIVEGPLLSIIRFSSENKAEATERRNFHVDKISVRKHDERAVSFWINNYIKSKRKPVDSAESNNDESQQGDTFNYDLVVLSLISSLRGLISENGYLLPWPFSSFELATNSHKLYTIFPIAMKIESIMGKSTFDIKDIFDDEIDRINCNYDSEIELVKIKVSVGLYDLNKEDNKLKRKSLELVTTNYLVEITELEKNKNFIGIVIGQAFKSIYEYPPFLIHAYGEEESKLIDLINIINDKINAKILKDPFYRNNIISIKRLIYETAYSSAEKPLAKLKSNDKLLWITAENIKTYKNIIENITGNSLQPACVFNTNI